MIPYLEKHSPARRQFTTRRATPTGAVVVHTTESAADLVLPDAGAENVAEWITRRTTPGSYHELVDSDSRVYLVDYDKQAFGEGTGGNRWALHLSFACEADQWPRLSPFWVDGALGQAVKALGEMNDWLIAKNGRQILPRRITAKQYRSGLSGFVSHGELDPGRRHDPGDGFPWSQLLARWGEAYALTNGETPDPVTPTPPPALSELTDVQFAGRLSLKSDLYVIYDEVADRRPSAAALSYWLDEIFAGHMSMGVTPEQSRRTITSFVTTQLSTEE